MKKSLTLTEITPDEVNKGDSFPVILKIDQTTMVSGRLKCPQSTSDDIKGVRVDLSEIDIKTTISATSDGEVGKITLDSTNTLWFNVKQTDVDSKTWNPAEECNSDLKFTIYKIN